VAVVAACTAAAVAVLSRGTSLKATALAGTLAAVVITEIVIMGTGVAVHLLVVVVIIRASAARLFAVVGKATPILTSQEVGDMTAAVVPLALGTVQWRLPALSATLRAVGRRTKIGGISLTSRLSVSRFRIFPGLGA